MSSGWWWDPNCFTSNLVNVGSRTALFILSAMAAFMGTLNSYREICKEREIILREASVGVSLPAVVLSKAFVLLLIEIVQAAILTVGFVNVVHIPQNHLLFETNLELFVTVLLMLFASSATGLLVSALFKSGETAILVVLVIMIGQVVFSGIMFQPHRRRQCHRQRHRMPLGHGRPGRFHRPEQPSGLAEGGLRRPHVRRHHRQPAALLADDGPHRGGLHPGRLAGAADLLRPQKGMIKRLVHQDEAFLCYQGFFRRSRSAASLAATRALRASCRRWTSAWRVAASVSA